MRRCGNNGDNFSNRMGKGNKNVLGTEQSKLKIKGRCVVMSGVQLGIQGVARVSVNDVPQGPRQTGELEEILIALLGAVERLDKLSEDTKGIISTPKNAGESVGQNLQSLQEVPMIMGVRLASAVERLHVIADQIERTNGAISEQMGSLKLY